MTQLRIRSAAMIACFVLFFTAVPAWAADEEGEHAGSTAVQSSEHEVHYVDTTHLNMSDPAHQVMDFRTDLAFFTAVVFLLLVAGLYLSAWKPIMQGLEKRERGIAENIARAQNSASEASQKLAEYESKLATASQDAQRIVAEARKDAEAAGQKLIAAAQEEAARQRERATADIESAKRVALSELAAQSTDIAMSLAQRVVGREVKAGDHQNLIQDMLSKLPSSN
ncbi:MAG: F0F1 ATP synthase subunit B [Planctomycetales bacterium]|nr:F0F1 ATP synthase subunit B [Planctomycetales bacterium]